MISGTSPGRIVAKVLIDQAVTAPPILATFYTGKPFHAYVVLTRLRQYITVLSKTLYYNKENNLGVYM